MMYSTMTCVKTFINRFESKTKDVVHTIVFVDDGYRDELFDWVVKGKFDINDPVIHDTLYHEFDSDYGTQECPNFVAYSKNFVMFNTEYDGADGYDYYPLSPDWYVFNA